MANGLLQVPGQERSTLQSIGLGLSGFGAGIQRQGTQFLAGQERQRQQLSLERQQAAAEDLRRAKAFADQGDFAGLLNLANIRIQAIQGAGGDPSDTIEFQGLAQGALNGDQTSATRLNSLINSGLQSAADAGVIQLAPQAAPPGTKAVLDNQTGQQAFATNAEIAANPGRFTPIPTAPKPPEDLSFKRIKDLRTEATGITSDFRKQAAAKKRIDAVSFNKDGTIKQTPAASLALIFNFMKVLDPGSVVRESEFRTAADARAALSRPENWTVPVPTRILQAVQGLTGEGTLTRDQIIDFTSQATAIFESAKIQTIDDLTPITSAAEFRGFPLDRIIQKSILDAINTQSAPQTPQATQETDFIIDENGNLVPNPRKR